MVTNARAYDVELSCVLSRLKLINNLLELVISEVNG
jgi:hypothetical protein